MKSIYILSKIVLTVIVGLFLIHCSDMNDLHDQYLRQGETIYVGQPDSSKVLPGLGRVMIHYWISDPKATKMVVYWNSREDSILTDIPNSPNTEPKELLIADLNEALYYFELITMNSEFKNRSIPLEVPGRVYGPKFQKTLLDRDMKYATFKAADTVFMQFFNPPEYYCQSEISYTDGLGNQVTTFIGVDESSVILEGYKENLKYRTLFVPEEATLDTLKSEFIQVTNIDKEIDKTSFAKWNPADIPYYELSAAYSIDKLWDDNLETWYIQTVPKLPHSFTFDLGKSTKISRIKQWQRLTPSVVYKIQGVKKFEVWGSDTPDVDGTFDGWTVLGVFESIKPSRKPSGQVDPEDIEFAAAGEDFMILDNAPSVRYIRYVVKETWDNKPTIAVGELSVFSNED